MRATFRSICAASLLPIFFGCGPLLDRCDDLKGTSSLEKNPQSGTYAYRDFWGRPYYVQYFGHAQVGAYRIDDLNESNGKWIELAKGKTIADRPER